MIRLLNTLYVTSHGAYLSKDGDNVVVSVDREEKPRVPIHILGSIICFVNTSCTPFLLGLCGEHHLTVSFLSENGRFLGRVHGPEEDFCFRNRSRKPPLDRMNALLSFLNTLLTHDVVSALEGIGLDAPVGFLHWGRPGLALDLVEELRPVLADRLALALVNRRQLAASNFKVTESGAVSMNDEERKTLLVSYQKRK